MTALEEGAPVSTAPFAAPSVYGAASRSRRHESAALQHGGVQTRQVGRQQVLRNRLQIIGDNAEMITFTEDESPPSARQTLFKLDLLAF